MPPGSTSPSWRRGAATPPSQWPACWPRSRTPCSGRCRRRCASLLAGRLRRTSGRAGHCCQAANRRGLELGNSQAQPEPPSPPAAVPPPPPPFFLSGRACPSWASSPRPQMWFFPRLARTPSSRWAAPAARSTTRRCGGRACGSWRGGTSPLVRPHCSWWWGPSSGRVEASGGWPAGLPGRLLPVGRVGAHTLPLRPRSPCIATVASTRELDVHPCFPVCCPCPARLEQQGGGGSVCGECQGGCQRRSRWPAAGGTLLELGACGGAAGRGRLLAAARPACFAPGS